MKKIFIFSLLFVLVFSTGCAKKDTQNPYEFKVYYLDNSRAELKYDIYKITDTKAENIVGRLFEFLEKTDKDSFSVFENGATINSWEITGQGVINIDIRESYYSMDNGDALLYRAAIVKTLMQVEGINYVAFTVNNSNMLNSNGTVVGPLNEASFVDGGYDEYNKKETQSRLYFANADGDKLVAGNVKIIYDGKVSILQAVVQKIIDGPEEDNAFSVVGSNTRLLSLIEKDGICYVNFDSAFLNYESSVLPEITLYAIVNSLCDTGRVNKVQFMVEGNSDIVFRDKMSLNHLYERNLDIVE